MIEINDKAIRNVSKYIKHVEISLDSFTNPEYYPPTGNIEDVARYFLFMVAIDHRTSYRGVSYEEWINGKLYHGADLLYKLGMMKYNEDPDFFSPKRMAKIKLKDVMSWLNYGKAKIWDINIRTMLLQDLGHKLLKLYHGKACKLIVESHGYLRRKGKGLIETLKVFKAYEDPVEKKAYLLVKFLERRGIIHIKDLVNVEIPVDNHLTRIAFRLNIVTLNPKLWKAISIGKHLTREEDVIIRLTVRKAYKEISRRAGILPLYLDDFLWMLGRRCCTKPLPKCDNCKVLKYSKCPLKNVCKGYRDPNYAKLTEHMYIRTWYY